MQNRLGPNLTEFMRHFLGAEGEDVRRMERLSVFYNRIARVSSEPNSELKTY